MRLIKSTIVFLSLINFSLAQQAVQFIDRVPDSFSKNYENQKHNYNPLNLGNYWQYASESGSKIVYIEKDTIVNNKTYFKKIDYRIYSAHDLSHFYNWEINDSTKQCSYMLDWEDLDEDGVTDDELLLDSLEIPDYHYYLSYRHTWKQFMFNYPTPAIIVDSSWVIIFNDTVMSRYVQYLYHFYEERVADKYGVILMQDEAASPIMLTGAIINNVQYGNIVSVEKNINRQLPHKTDLYQNYPNPFNAQTQIRYNVKRAGPVKISVFDVRGRLISVLVNENKSPGRYQIPFYGTALSSGVYICEVQVNDYALHNKMILIR